MEPLLRWLHVGGKGYGHGCTKDIQLQTDLESLANRISSGAFAGDLIYLSTKIADLPAQAESCPFTQTGLLSLSQGKRQR